MESGAQSDQGAEARGEFNLVHELRPDVMTGSEEPRPDRRLARAVAEELRILVIAGVATGVLVIGVGSRLAMMLLRVTSGAPVHRLKSDDGFIIGRFTLSGSYNLLLLGATAGVIGAGAYQWVRPWLLGPPWLRSVSLALGSGAVVGSMLVHSDGIDFRVLRPTWLAIALFVALPAAFAAAIGRAVDAVDRTASQTRRGAKRFIVPAAAAVMFPLALFPLAFAVPVLIFWVGVRNQPGFRRLVERRAFRFAARTAWLGVAVVGLAALLGDISDVAAVT